MGSIGIDLSDNQAELITEFTGALKHTKEVAKEHAAETTLLYLCTTYNVAIDDYNQNLVATQQ